MYSRFLVPLDGSPTSFLALDHAAELARLQRENKRLKEKLERAELIIDVQKKVARLIGETPPPPSEEN